MRSESIIFLVPGVRVIEKHELGLLGSPVFPEAIPDALAAKHLDFERMVSRLEEIDAHDALFLLRNVFFIPKLTYLLRTAPCFLLPDVLSKFDNSVHSSIQKILNVRLEENQWEQCSLPVSLGGLGIRKATDISLPAFISSTLATQEEVNNLLPQNTSQWSPFLSEAKNQWKEKLQPTVPAFPGGVSQEDWDLPVCEFKFNRLLESLQSMSEQARLRAVCQKGASDWLHAMPVTSLGLKLSDAEVRISCGLRLGSPLCHTHTCSCGERVNPDGRHGLSCRSSAGPHSRHNHINDLIQRAFGRADISAIVEPPGLSRSDGKRPDGLTIFPYKHGKKLIWDFTCVDTFATTYVHNTSKKAGKAAEEAEKRKEAKYKELIDDGYIFIPVAIETMGPLGMSGFKLFQELGKKISNKYGEKNATSYILQSISIAIQRGNTLSILGTPNDQRKLDEIFYL